MANQAAQTAAAVGGESGERRGQLAVVDAVHQLVRTAAGTARKVTDVDAGTAACGAELQVHRNIRSHILNGSTILGITSYDSHILQAIRSIDRTVVFHAECTGEVDVLHRAAVQIGNQAAELYGIPITSQFKINVDRLTVAIKRSFKVGDTIESVVLVR